MAFRTLEAGVTEETRETLRQVVLIGTALPTWRTKPCACGWRRRCVPPLEELVGREVVRLDPFLVDALLRGRRVRVGEQDYGLTLRRALLGEEVLVVLGAQPARSPASEAS